MLVCPTSVLGHFYAFNTGLRTGKSTDTVKQFLTKLHQYQCDKPKLKFNTLKDQSLFTHIGKTMTQTNRLSKLVKATSKLPKGIQSTILSKAFGRVVPMVGTAKLRYVEVTHSRVEVKIENHKNMQNHIGQVHACAMALVTETATGFVTGMNIPDSCIVLIKSMQINFKRPSKGALTAIATLTDEQRKLMQETEKGETLVSVTVTDESGQQPIEAEMLWAWVSKDRLKNK